MLGSDRSNVLLLASQVYPGHSTTDMTQFGHLGRNYPAHLNKSSFLGLSYADRRTLAFLLPSKCLCNSFSGDTRGINRETWNFCFKYITHFRLQTLLKA